MKTSAELDAERGNGRRWAITLGSTAALGLWLWVKPGGATAAAWAGTVGNIACPALGLWWWATAPKAATDVPTGRCRDGCALAWLLLGLSTLAFFIGQVIFYYYCLL